nr:hypothetical protein [Tanacetum cinerariifolium]
EHEQIRTVSSLLVREVVPSSELGSSIKADPREAYNRRSRKLVTRIRTMKGSSSCPTGRVAGLVVSREAWEKDSLLEHWRSMNSSIRKSILSLKAC